ncbi:hypothetical protein SK128_003696 [Halocaridina rubra]|uniref:Uncharacterized protein n=1 Tax=Halocaridina rubra TaxID=373956 RepID=A0AAN8WKU7_HALRR
MNTKRPFRVGGSESPPLHDISGGRGNQGMYIPLTGQKMSRSCHDIPGSLGHSRSACNLTSLATKKKSSSEHVHRISQGPSAPHYDKAHSPGKYGVKRALAATRSAPRVSGINNCRQRDSSSPKSTESPSRSSPRVYGVRNGGFENVHTALGNRMSWSPSRLGQQQPYRLRVFSESQGRNKKGLSRSVRIKKWVQNKHNRLVKQFAIMVALCNP